MKKNVLLTGGTGFVGRAALARLAELPTYDRIYLLVRSLRDKSATERVRDIVTRMFPRGRVDELLSRIEAVDGDLTAPGMGISEETLGRLKGNLHQILHVGASTDFGAPLAASRLANVEGTRHALDVACRLRADGGVLERFDYVSTAYVSGDMAGCCDEETLERGQTFANNYEQSKYEAELLVRSYRDRLPIAIYRPSIVVGDSRNGYTPHFKVLYWPLLILAKNLAPFIATNKNALLDVVPVDYVGDGIVALMQQPDSLGRTWYLTGGRGNELKIREFLRDSWEIAGVKRRPVVPFWLFNLVRNTPLRRIFHDSFWEVVNMATPYFRYMQGTGVTFDSTISQARLAQLGVKPPRWDEYKREVFGFCLASRWGRRLPLPEYAYFLPATGAKEGDRREPADRTIVQRVGAPCPAT